MKPAGNRWDRCQKYPSRRSSALTRARLRGTIFDRIHRDLANGSDLYLIEKYASCETQSADRDADGRNSVRFCLPDGAKAGVHVPRCYRTHFDIECASASSSTATGTTRCAAGDHS